MYDAKGVGDAEDRGSTFVITLPYSTYLTKEGPSIAVSNNTSSVPRLPYVTALQCTLPYFSRFISTWAHVLYPKKQPSELSSTYLIDSSGLQWPTSALISTYPSARHNCFLRVAIMYRRARFSSFP